MVATVDNEIEDSEAIRSILSLWDSAKRIDIDINDPYRWRGIDDPKYPEIQREYEQEVHRRDGLMKLLVTKVNEYIDRRIVKSKGFKLANNL